MANYTPNYQLHQWEPEDKFLRTDFNADLSRIDTTLGELRNSTNEHSNVLANLKNCQVYATSYTGTGYFTQDNPTSVTLPGVPAVMMVMGGNGLLLHIFGKRTSPVWIEDGFSTLDITWSGNTASWYSEGGDIGQMNERDVLYFVFAFYIYK